LVRGPRAGRRNTQLIIQHKTQVTRGVDPLGGSYYVEALTHSLATHAQALIDEVEAMGGMTRATVAGVPKLRIEEAAARRQARVDRREDVIVGVNRFQLETEAPLETRDIDNAAVRAQQVARLEAIKAKRDPKAVETALAALREGAASRQKVQPFAFHAATMAAGDAPHLELQNNPQSGAGQVANPTHPAVVPTRLNPPATATDRFFERRSRLTIRTFGSPNTPRTVSFARKPANEYPSDRRRRRVAVLAIPHHARFQHPSKRLKPNARRPFPAMTPRNRPLDSLKSPFL
jgi:methylmalonyl-CoA mutase